MSAAARLDDIWNDWRDERRRDERNSAAEGALGSSWLAAEVRARLLEFLSAESALSGADDEASERVVRLPAPFAPSPLRAQGGGIPRGDPSKGR